MEIDQKIVEAKVSEISKSLDGMRIPEVFAILGSFVVSMVSCVNEDGFRFDKLVAEWLRNLADQVESMEKPDDYEDENEQTLVN